MCVHPTELPALSKEPEVKAQVDANTSLPYFMCSWDPLPRGDIVYTVSWAVDDSVVLEPREVGGRGEDLLPFDLLDNVTYNSEVGTRSKVGGTVWSSLAGTRSSFVVVGLYVCFYLCCIISFWIVFPWVGLFRLQPDFRIQTSVRRQ